MKTLPTIHLNGTRKEDLLEAVVNPLKPLREAKTLLGQATPNGRDYPGGQFFEAREEFNQLRARLNGIIKELEEYAEAISDL